MTDTCGTVFPSAGCRDRRGLITPIDRRCRIVCFAAGTAAGAGGLLVAGVLAERERTMAATPGDEDEGGTDSAAGADDAILGLLRRRTPREKSLMRSMMLLDCRSLRTGAGGAAGCTTTRGISGCGSTDASTSLASTAPLECAPRE